MLRTVCLLVAALVLAGCSDGPGPAAAPGSTAPATGTSSSDGSPEATASASPPVPPRTGACYRLRSGELTRPSSSAAPVPCSGRHTSRTMFVGRLRRNVPGAPVAVDSEQVRRKLATTCPRKLAAYVGGTATQRDLSRLNVVWFTPAPADLEAGAAWFRCDVIAFSRADALLTLPARSLKGVLGRPGALGTYGLCGTAAPGSTGFERVVCSRPHSWRALSTIPLDDGRGSGRYPGVARVQAAGDSPCKDQARARADDELRFSYGWEWPTAAQWTAGQRFGYCWVPA